MPRCLILFIPLLASACVFVKPVQLNKNRPFGPGEMKQYELVYSLPGKDDPSCARLAELFASAPQRPFFKSVIEVERYKAADGPGRIMAFGTADANPLVRKALDVLGVRIGKRDVSIGGRNYELSPYAFTACFEMRGKTVFLVAGPDHAGLPIPFSFFSFEGAPAEGSYQLLNDEYRIVERGEVRQSGAGRILVPTLVHDELAFTPERRLKEWDVACQIPSGTEDFAFVDSIAAGKKIFFIGEGIHHDDMIHKAAVRLSLHLRRELGYRVLVLETYLSLWPYLEAYSMGNEAQLSSAYRRSARNLVDHDLRCGDVLDAIAEYNRGVPDGKKLVCTATDVDSIQFNSDKAVTMEYLQHLASRSSSGQTRSELARKIPELSGLQDERALREYVDGLERIFRTGWDSFEPKDRDEIDRTLSIERASISWQRSRTAENYDKTRGESFRRGIERALSKAEGRGGALICFAGSAHTRINYPGEWPIRLTEGRYFSAKHPASKGRVASLLIEHIGGNAGQGPLAKVALALMSDRDRIFFDLRDKCWSQVENRPLEFFTRGGPRYDGVLFIK